MRDFVVYHNPDSMGIDVTQMDALSIVTDKPAGDVTGDRVWLITGRGKPRRFLLRSYFFVDQIETERTEGFKTKLSGKTGKIFEPMIELNEEDWFADFKRTQGRFAFGLQRIADEVVRALESLTRPIA